LKRALQKELVQPLAIRLLRGEFQDGDTVLLEAHDGKFDFRRQEAAVAAAG
jgi:ATP-dependent Clp protease ATP-binding subunit ClpB